MARYTLVYGLRLIPKVRSRRSTMRRYTLADAASAGVTQHTFDGTIPQLRRSLDRSLDAFLRPSAGGGGRGCERFAD
jgi:hypothetical protein